MINFPIFHRYVVGTPKRKHASTTQSTAIGKDSAQKKSDRRRAADRRKQRTRAFRAMDRRCSDRRSGRIHISV